MQRISRSAEPEHQHLGLTKTGRISKAKKGRRVHDCTTCGKSYTRAEHLRRHQLNHGTDNLRCDYAGCQKVFHREDLLARHKERHELEGDANIASPDPDTEGPAPVAGPGPVQVSGRPRTATQSTIYPVKASPVVRSHSFNIPTNFDTLSGNESLPGLYHPPDFSAGQTSSAASEQWHASPMSQPSLEFDASHVDATVTDPDYLPSISLAHGATTTQFLEVPHDLCEHSSTTPFSEVPPETDHPWTGWFNEVSRSSSAPVALERHPSSLESFEFNPQENMHLNFPLAANEYRDAVEAVDLGLKISATPLHHVDQPLITDFPTRVYLDHFWQQIHPRYPIVHRPSFDEGTAVPLLRASMLAFGAQSSNSQADRDFARALHEKCLKVLKKRVQDACRSTRICDMQAMFFIELFAQTKAKRTPRRLSKQFHHLFQALRSDQSLVTPVPLDSMLSLHYPPGDPSVPLDWTDQIEWVRLVARQRLLLACYVLESQQQVLYPREQSSTQVSGLCLPFPFPTSVWDTATPEMWNAMICHKQMMSKINDVNEALATACAPRHEHADRYDAFQSAILVAASTEAEHRILEPAFLDAGYGTQAQYHATVLRQHISLRALLAVSGETWIMGEKLSNNAEYARHKEDLRLWAAQQATSTITSSSLEHSQSLNPAVLHALEILRLALGAASNSLAVQSMSGAPFEEWTLYMAALTLWACAYAHHHPSPPTSASITTSAPSSRRGSRAFSRTSAPSPSLLHTTTANQTSAAQIAIVEIGRGDWDAVVSSRNILSLLQWVQDTVASYGRSGGVVEATLVLGRVTKRFEEDGWF